MKNREINRSDYAFMKRSDYLQCLRKIYEEDSLDYLIALRDGLSIIIARRLNPSEKPIEKYEGYVKYL